MPTKAKSVSKPTTSELEEWNRKLAGAGLSMDAGLDPNKRVMYVESTDIYQQTKIRTGSRGGRLRRYQLGERVAHRLTCSTCGNAFPSKRRDARTCSVVCRKAKSRKNVTDKSLDSEEHGK